MGQGVAVLAHFRRFRINSEKAPFEVRHVCPSVRPSAYPSVPPPACPHDSQMTDFRKILILMTIMNICREYPNLIKIGHPVGARFSAPVHTSSGAHPASYTMGTGCFPEVNRPGPGVDYPSQLAPRLKERVELYLYSPSGP